MPQEPASASGGLGATAETEPLSPVTLVADEEKDDDAASTVMPRWDEGVTWGIQKCWGAMTSFFQLVVNQLDLMNPLGSQLNDSFLKMFWMNLETSSQEALKLFEDFERSTQCTETFLAQKVVIRSLVQRIVAGHGRFQIQVRVQELLSSANISFADVARRGDEEFSVGTAKSSKARRVMVKLSWILQVLKAITDNWGRGLDCSNQQKLMLKSHELDDPTVVAVRTDRDGVVVFQSFKLSLPSQRLGVQWALSCMEVNWDYDCQGVRFRFMENRKPHDRIPLLSAALEHIARLHYAILNENIQHFVTPPSYDHGQVQDCPVLLWLKPVPEKEDKHRSRSPPAQPPAAGWSSSSSSWLWHQGQSPWHH